MPSGVYRFKISELDGAEPILLARDGKDPHLVVKIETAEGGLAVGANGLGFAADGTMYIGNFDDASIVEVKFDDEGKVVSQKDIVKGDPIESSDGLKVDQETGMIYLADFLGNAVHQIDPKTGKVVVLAKNGITDGKDGALDKCSEVALRDGKVYVSNIDLPLGGNEYDAPHTISVIELKKD